LLDVLMDSAKLIDEAFHWAKNGMKECTLTLKDPIHESANRLCNGNNEGKIDQDLGNTK
jgi:hypothetical protein